MRSVILVIALSLATSASAHVASASEPDGVAAREREEVTLPSPSVVSSAAGKKLVDAFDKARKAARKLDAEPARLQAELVAVRELAAGASDKVAKRLSVAAADDRLLSDARVLALRALSLQGKPGRKQSKRLLKWIGKESKSAADDCERGRIGVPINRRTGNPITNTPEAREALRRGEERARLHAVGIEVALVLDARPKEPGDLLRPFLQSPEDALAIAAIHAARAWEAKDVLPELALLLRMYPRANRWETGAVTHLGGTNASAKAAWMSLFGHPRKQRARPRVHRAVVEVLSAWAGREITDSATLDAWMRTRD